jgi:NADH:ubiquinone oxidoreductase subunit 5 (subunit L)/multisubunit Na+/H+ antiporter MnhA subunit
MERNHNYAGPRAAFGAVVVGVTQSDAKTILAYSSISQMGVMTIALGVGLAEPEAWPVVLSVLTIYAFSHGLAKGTLFLGVGVADAAASRTARLTAMAGLALAAAAIAGAPMTGGAIVKKALSDVISFAPGTWADRLEWLLVASAIATTVLLGRFLQIVDAKAQKRAEKRAHPSLWWAWTFSLTAAAIGVWVAVPLFAIDVPLPGLAVADTWDAVWPVGVGVLLLTGWWGVFRKRAVHRGIPAGDVLVLFTGGGRLMRRFWHFAETAGSATPEINFGPLVDRVVESERKRAAMSRIERNLMRSEVAGACFVMLLVIMIILLIQTMV